MSDTLHRNLPTPDGHDRYGAWRLASDDDAAAADGHAPAAAGDAPLTSHKEDFPAYQAEVLALMRRQRRLSVLAALVLFGIVGGVMVTSYVWFDAVAKPIWHGFSLSFLFVALLVYPLTWVVAVVYTLLSNRMDGLN
jgi:uncharacterized membrane protein (DUF485 family)